MYMYSCVFAAVFAVMFHFCREENKIISVPPELETYGDLSTSHT